MRALNMNAYRTYNIDTANGDHGDFFSACCNNGVNPVYVLVGSGQLNNVGLYDPPNPTAFTAALQNFTQLVQAYGSNPAVLGFVIGNEVNNPTTIASDGFWQNINQLCNVIHQNAPG
jgi:hypothetical protein